MHEIPHNMRFRATEYGLNEWVDSKHCPLERYLEQIALLMESEWLSPRERIKELVLSVASGITPDVYAHMERFQRTPNDSDWESACQAAAWVVLSKYWSRHGSPE